MKTSTSIILRILTAVVIAFITRWYLFDYKAASAVPHNALIVGTNVGYPPFIFADETGAPAGFDVAIAEAIAAKLNRPLVIKDMSFDALLLSLTAGRVDLIIGGITITPTRKASGLLIPYYGDCIDRVSCFYKKDRNLKDISLTQAAARGLTVCTQAGSNFEDILMAYPGLMIKTLPDISDIFIEVCQGGSAFGVLDTDSVRALVRKDPSVGSHDLILPKELIVEGFGIGIKPNDPALRAAVESAVKELVAEGIIKKHATLWFGTKE